MTVRWEYRCDLMGASLREKLADLARKGRDGWELVQLDDTTPRLAWFKRRIDDSSDDVIQLRRQFQDACAMRDDLDRVVADIASELGCAVDNEHILEVISKLKEERDKYRAALERLGSVEAMVLAGAWNEEVMARIDYARKAVSE